jgi:hypothetical protein
MNENIEARIEMFLPSCFINKLKVKREISNHHATR